ncbi:hypothetical protein GCM10010170_058740 [Dactylosporangium salmoneum]|uniref:Uncharacterized protein n=2 Tax=Dactylosporangium salmoneum TaxID=53361 RepID=A0ABP5TV78_9ACTN
MLGLAGLLWSVTSRTAAAGRWSKWLLFCGIVGTPVEMVGCVLLGQWATGILFTVVGLLVFTQWESQREADGQRIWLQPWLDRTVLRRIPLSRRYVDRAYGARGDRGLTLTDLRTEYASVILADATRDAVLDALLDKVGSRLLETVLRIEADMGPAATSRLITRYMILTGIANGVLANATDPGVSIGASPYRGYSQPMLTIAAACRLGSSDELKAIHHQG